MLRFPRIVGWMLVGAVMLSLAVLAPAAAQVVCSEPSTAGPVCNTSVASTPSRLAAAEPGAMAGQPVALSLYSLGAGYAALQPSSLVAGNRLSGQYQATTTYVVVFGDNLYRISLRFGTTVQAIMQANPSIVNPNRIYAGQVLLIPVGGATAPPVSGGYTPVPQPTAVGGTTQYTVVRGDRLYRIALRYGTTVSAIVQANPGITNPNLIYPGQVLVIPSGSAAGVPTSTPTPVPTSTAPLAPAIETPLPTATVSLTETQVPTTAPTSPVTSPAATAATPAMTTTVEPTASISTLTSASPSPTSMPMTSAPALAPSPQATSAPGQGVATINLTAHNIAFDPASITVPAGAHVVVDFSNQDPVPHNFAVYTNSTAQQVIFRGQVITGPNASTTYEFTAPAQPGTYFFRCDIHPAQMMGQFIVQ